MTQRSKLMLKFAVVVPIVFVLSGCKDDIDITIEDNSPGKYERLDAMRVCVDEWDPRDAPEEIRLACTQAIYGGK